MSKIKCLNYSRSIVYRSFATSKMNNTKTLMSAVKTQSFTSFFEPDPETPSPKKVIEIAKDESKREFLHKPRLLESGSFSYCIPEKRNKYKFLLASENALRDLGLSLDEQDNPEFQKIVSGEEYLENPLPYSQCYAGWQFGLFAGQLGDGRVLNLFEITNDETKKRYELQLKGSGKTPFSRFADGKAVLRSSIREFIISEALNAIGIPTTRAVSLSLLPNTKAQRTSAEQCAIVCRAAETWVRLGTFDLYRWRGDRDGIQKLSNYVIDEVLGGEKNLPNFKNVPKEIGDFTKYDRMFMEIVRLNALTVASWQTYGFLNGVLNTDNTSVKGLSMDFGPFAIMDKFDPNYTPNSEDHNLRYSFRGTPTAIWWNLTKLCENIIELIGAGGKYINHDDFKNGNIDKDMEKDIIERAKKLYDFASDFYYDIFSKEYYKLISKRLGLTEYLDTDLDEILTPMLEMLQKTKLDYNNFFVTLQNWKFKIEDQDFDFDQVTSKFIPENYEELTSNTVDRNEAAEKLKDWLASYRARLASANISDTQRLEISSTVNPLFFPKNWILDDVIQYTQEHQSEEGDVDTKYLKKLLLMVSNPYDSSKWGDFGKDLEKKWLNQVNDEMTMTTCSCSS
ncbi:hypothetical protein PACTADRAFT_1005 [Pachysolen tannophilus NRRL Y-2460]|uniref:Selenoprotein O n=1 Tax=Pachysolen tannophilus NRRL Y-2460 TaxID=669874 RepID=A0A1E4U3F0_PACTA|nr:hypothetical protein PACTADRAFT_1005 [Pachysolen tannophilus NRRL Y-2460]